jgi:biotin carboxylase
MNVLLLSPHFPPNFQNFASRLKEAGANVLGIGDAPVEDIGEIRSALSDYCHLSNMSEYDGLLRAAGWLIHRHGKIERVDSHNEHWLGMEARLRQDFNIFGQRPSDLDFNRRKSGMKEIFRQAGIPAPAGEIVSSAAQIRAFVKRRGFPVIFKPDIGVGAERVFRVDNEAQLAGVLEYPPKQYFLEAFVEGGLVSFDGLTDREGGIVFCASHRVSSGIMDIVSEQRPVHYYYTRDIAPEIEDLGRKAVAAFRIQERFFHLEFLIDSRGQAWALEINVRPPGGYSLDMMNWACDIDLYRLWARSLVCGESHFEYQRKFNVAHVARRERFRYHNDHERVLRELGPMVVAHMPLPPLFRVAMGDYAYFLRHPDLGALRQAVAFIERQA